MEGGDFGIIAGYWFPTSRMSSFPNVFIVGEQGSLPSSFSRQWLFVIKFFCVWKHLQRFWLWDCIIIIAWLMWVNWTTMKLIALRSQHIWNMHNSLLNICTCLQNDSSNRKGELGSLERALEVCNFCWIFCLWF